jgi:hypothetical protein
LHDLYGTKDFSQRDQELARVIPALQRFLPEAALSTIADAVELDAISERLDHAVAKVLLEGPKPAEKDCSLEHYRAAYQAVHLADAAARDRQLALVQKIGTALNGLVKKPLLGGLLKTMGPVAHAAGLSSMHDFLMRGFEAFKTMGDASTFLQLIQTRESAIHQAMISKMSDELVERVVAPNGTAG